MTGKAKSGHEPGRHELKKKRDGDEKPDLTPDVFNWTLLSFAAFLIIVVGSLFTRLYKVEFPREVLFDEVHFVTFAQDYAAGRRVFDIHPPLCKLWLALIVKLSGFHTNVPYREISTVYKHDGYIWLRTSQALWGSTLPIIGFLSVRELGGSPIASFVVGALMIMELSLQTVSRAVFMDAFLYASIAIAFYCALKLWNEAARLHLKSSFAFWWWTVQAGFWMGCAFSIKHTGLGVIGVVGVIHLIKTFSPHLRRASGSSIAPGTGFARMFISGVAMVFEILSVYIGAFGVHFYLKAESYRSDWSFLYNVWDCNMKMIRANSVSVFHHHHGSQWWEWPFLYRGLVYWWKDLPDGTHICVYLFGNPIVYWLVLLTIAVSLLYFDKKFWVVFIEGVRPSNYSAKLQISALICLFGWVANYLPYPLFITRTCFVYHYHPSLYFGILLCGIVLDLLARNSKNPNATRVKIAAPLMLLVVVCYLYYLPFSYALPITQEEHEERRMMYFFPILRKIFPIW